MSEKIVYILGSGFSAPLGLPVMNNFLIKSKDLYFSNTDKYKHFKSVFDKINELSVSKNYYSADLFNIEEILSIIEMGSFLEGQELKKVFTDYILDVIKFYTPEIKPVTAIDTIVNWKELIFGSDNLLKKYGYFTGNLLGMEFKPIDIQNSGGTIKKLLVRRFGSPLTSYAIITLNYDLVLENFCKFIMENYETEGTIKFNTQEDLAFWNEIPLAKLHGSLDTGVIVPPTWAKGNNPKINSIWKNAYKILCEANHIRFIGYSLPIADSYIKFLLKSAVVKTEHLKSIDVICLDNDGSVRKRYDEFLEFNYYKFANVDVTEYLTMLSSQYKGISPRKEMVRMNALEKIHYTFMNEYQ